MKKYWIVQGSYTPYDTQAIATDAAKLSVSRSGYDKRVIFEAVAFVSTPVPDLPVTLITA